MSGTRYGIETNEITWEAAESEVKINNTGGIEITVVGSVGVGSSVTSVEDALALIPITVPISSLSPIGNSTAYLGAKLVDIGGGYLGDDTIQVNATYEYANPSNLQPGGDELKDASDSDRAVRTIAVEDAPLLSHPIVKYFPLSERKKLSGLLSGNIEVNPKYDQDGLDSALWEYRTFNIDIDNFEEVVFSTDDYTTTDGITASPLDYAKLISIGITVYRRPIVRHSITRQRNEPVSNSSYSLVGEALDFTPALAPELNGGQWFFNGITDSTTNGSIWTAQLEFEYTAQGGAIGAIYRGGEAQV